MSEKPVLLVIRDGWGECHDETLDAYNAVKNADVPCSRRLTQEWPRTEIIACGLDVGLPSGVMGNSEVGHQNIGAGRVVNQEVVRISNAIAEGDLVRNEVLLKAFLRARDNGKKVHFMGLASSAGVHSILDHLYALMNVACLQGMRDIYLHLFMDGRDSPPFSGMHFIQQIKDECIRLGVGEIATVCGRFWAMDRDKRWVRVQKAYDCLTGRNVERTAESAEEAVRTYYNEPLDESRQGDEFILPTQIVRPDGTPIGVIEDGDSVIFFNYRGDRPRELTRAFIDPALDSFDRGKLLDIYYVTLTEYESGLCPNVVFPKPAKMKHILGAFLSERGIRQFRCAETEKYPHVTFFFNDYRDEPFEGEDRALIASPKEVATYDQKPEMSSTGVTDAAYDAILSGKYGLIVVNYANGDMVGHTGSFEAAKKACEAVDRGLSRLLEAIDEVGGKALITADHGNADEMWDFASSSPHTRHTLNPVEVVLYGAACKNLKLKPGGRLADIAPTLLDMMGLEKPPEMTGNSLILKS